MGAAGVLMLGAVFYFFKSFVSLFKFLDRKDDPVVIGVIGELLREETISNSLKRTYSFTLQTEPEQVVSEYTAVGKAGAEPALRAGDRIEVYYDAANNKWAEVAKLKKNLKRDPLTCLGCLAALFACLLLVSSLTR